MTIRDTVLAILAILCIPLETLWKVLCIVPAVVALPVCILLDHVEHKRGNKGYAVTGMACTMGRLSSIPRIVFMRMFGEEDEEMERYLKDVKDFEEKGL